MSLDKLVAETVKTLRGQDFTYEQIQLLAGDVLDRFNSTKLHTERNIQDMLKESVAFVRSAGEGVIHQAEGVFGFNKKDFSAFVDKVNESLEINKTVDQKLGMAKVNSTHVGLIRAAKFIGAGIGATIAVNGLSNAWSATVKTPEGEKRDWAKTVRNGAIAAGGGVLIAAMFMDNPAGVFSRGK